MKKRVSIKDIAEAAGVSTALVSYVLNNKEKEARVGKEMAIKIREIAKQLNYQPNQLAKSLKSGKSYTIGLIVADISNPFFSNIARTIEDEAKKNNYTVIFGSSDENAEKSKDLIDVLINRQVDGFIIAPTENSEEQIQNLEDRGIPLVLIDRYFPDIPTNYVVTDNYKASVDAVHHLVDCGYKKVGLVTYQSNLIHICERRRGSEEALRQRGLSLDPSQIAEIRFGNIEEDISAQIDKLLNAKDPVDSIFFATNTLALNGLKYINALDYKIPDDLGIVCFDEGDAFDFFYSPLTHVYQPLFDVASKAVNVLLNQINDPQKPKEEIVIASELVIRKSSGA
ncbi:LacI family DNA-binding transcriptional regulator [Albibacterium indicum]|uniref:LacI family DNA-binding transcriptional regulator n=1 Tax=Albibacterium indicum TaxID=2292082 RepID=UPI000E4EB114|nr:substrate-binding domain-containing protein [Pedobacter indicus]